MISAGVATRVTVTLEISAGVGTRVTVTLGISAGVDGDVIPGGVATRGSGHVFSEGV